MNKKALEFLIESLGGLGGFGRALGEETARGVGRGVSSVANTIKNNPGKVLTAGALGLGAKNVVDSANQPVITSATGQTTTTGDGQGQGGDPPPRPTSTQQKNLELLEILFGLENYAGRQKIDAAIRKEEQERAIEARKEAMGEITRRTTINAWKDVETATINAEKDKAVASAQMAYLSSIPNAAVMQQLNQGAQIGLSLIHI